MEHENRVVVLIDMDCFYCQVEEKLDPELKGKPIAVVQYNPWKGGGIIAVNYVARAMGVTRHMRGDEAKAKCPEIQLPSVPCQRGKADTTKYREAGVEVAKVLQRFTPLLERASVDEAYMDITASVEERLRKLPTHSVNPQMLPNSYALGYEDIGSFINDTNGYSNENIDYDVEHTKRLLIGAVIVSEVRAAVYDETGYQCSAGIAHNKILAKLVCGMNKPNKQTILPKHSINTLYRTLLLKKVKHLGGKFGDTVCDVLNISKMCELQSYSEKELQARFDDKNGTWLYNIARGIDQEPVQAKFNPKSIGCCKQFRGKSALADSSNLKKWLRDLVDEIVDRLEKDAVDNNRYPRQMVVSYATQLKNFKDVNSSRSYNFTNDDNVCADFLYTKALDIILESIDGCKEKENDGNRALKAPIKFLGISVGKFEDNDNKKSKKILDYFTAGTSKGFTKTTEFKEFDNKKLIDKDYLMPDKNNTVEQKILDEINCNKGQHINVDRKSPILQKRAPTDKEYLINKFFQVTDKKNTENKVTNNVASKEQNVNVDRKSPILQNRAFNLEQQESFFAKYLKHNLLNKLPKNEVEPQANIQTKNSPKKADLQEPDKGCSENSNDSIYSASTINEEISRSMCLEGDTNDVERLSELRGLLNHSIFPQEDSNMSSGSGERVEEPNSVETTSKPPAPKLTKICEECGKTIPIEIIVTHTDYHLAVKLRNEEREVIRKEIKDKNDKRIVKVANDTQNSITKFVTKIDCNIPVETCTECGKRVPIGDFEEHKDFHEAQRLSRQLNNRSAIITNSSVKRKRNITPIKKSKIPCRPINSFFR